MTITPAPFSGPDRVGPGYAFALRESGIDVVDVADDDDLEAIAARAPVLAIVDVTAAPSIDLRRVAIRCADLQVPLIAMVSRETLAELESAPNVADFVVVPPGRGELLARARRVLNRLGGDAEDQVRVGDLAINTATYEVSVGGRRVDLRFKEYELLLLMAANPGRVYTREALLNNIWGYDYLGGTRTVDVHIRRLRSKIEDAEHLFIETVWNVGYRFKAA
jgi:DNA-binding response OmpR family regulator